MWNYTNKKNDNIEAHDLLIYVIRCKKKINKIV